MSSGVSCQIVLSLGSNFQREGHFHQAFDALDDVFDELLFSPVYESLPLTTNGDIAQADHRPYYNVVVSFMSDMPLQDLKLCLSNIEHTCGRDRSKAQVAIDIDLLLFGDYVESIVENNDAIVSSLPRADILTCAYVLRPLADLLPDMLHPIQRCSFGQLWADFCHKESNMAPLTPVDFVWREQVISVSPSCLVI